MIGSELIARRKKVRTAWREWLRDSQPNYCLTLTFSPSTSFERASATLDEFHKRLLKELMGRRYYKKDNQPFGIAFTEYASTKFQVSKLGAPHFHILYWIPNNLEAKTKALDIEPLWHFLNPISNRTAHLDDITQKQAPTIKYVTKDFPMAPLDHEFIMLGQPEKIYHGLGCSG
jgi:hypothetical protein